MIQDRTKNNIWTILGRPRKKQILNILENIALNIYGDHYQGGGNQTRDVSVVIFMHGVLLILVVWVVRHGWRRCITTNRKTLITLTSLSSFSAVQMYVSIPLPLKFIVSIKQVRLAMLNDFENYK